MVAELWKNLKKVFAPYTLEDYILDHQPQSREDVERLEKEYFLFSKTKFTKGY